MDIMESITVDVTGGLWSLPVVAIAICAAVITFIVHLTLESIGFRNVRRLR